jgi:Fic family protein
MSRQSISKYVFELKADGNKMFSYCVPDSLHAQLHQIDKLTGGGHVIGDANFFSAGERDQYLVKNLMMEEAITSSQLEGASTTRKVAKEMLQSKRIPQSKSEQMIFNNFLLMKKSLEKKDEELSIDLILELHRIATLDAIDNDAIAGELRNNNDVNVTDIYIEVAHEPPCHTTVKERLVLLCEFANTCNDSSDSNVFIHPIIKATMLHFMMGYIHPFGDGNGRTARALFYWFMLKSGYWLFEYVSISKLIQEKRSDYDMAYLYTETDDFDLTYFIYHQVDIVLKAVRSLDKHINEKRQAFYQFMQWIDKSPVSKKLKRGQLEILKEAINEPGKVFLVAGVALELDITESTARTYLNKLVDEDLLLATNSSKTKTIRYIAPAGLRDRLVM